VFYVTFSNSLGMEVAKTYWKDYTLYWNVYIICNGLILYQINCVTTNNELIGMFVSLGSEVAEGSVLSGRIVQVSVNSVKWHQVNASCKFWIGTWNNCLSALNNWPRDVTIDRVFGIIGRVTETIIRMSGTIALVKSNLVPRRCLTV
jgi:hypothetical protein